MELAVNDSASGGAFGQRVNFTGVITDTLCLDWAQPEFVNVTTNAPNHTRNCILECFDFGSGFTMLGQVENASMPEGIEYRGMYNAAFEFQFCTISYTAPSRVVWHPRLHATRVGR